jgi:hypothetical protein
MNIEIERISIPKVVHLHLKEWKIPNIIAAVWFSAKKKTGI